MTRPMITPQISLGNIITLAVLGISMATTWAYMDAAVSQNTDAIKEVRASASGVEARLRVVESAKEAQAVAWANMTRSLEKIEAQQNETNALIRQIYAQMGQRRNEQ